jgi:hypothetical protein
MEKKIIELYKIHGDWSFITDLEKECCYTFDIQTTRREVIRAPYKEKKIFISTTSNTIIWYL